jgi:hypothetical protein
LSNKFALEVSKTPGEVSTIELHRLFFASVSAMLNKSVKHTFCKPHTIWSCADAVFPQRHSAPEMFLSTPPEFPVTEHSESESKYDVPMHLSLPVPRELQHHCPVEHKVPPHVQPAAFVVAVTPCVSPQ